MDEFIQKLNFDFARNQRILEIINRIRKQTYKFALTMVALGIIKN